VKEIQPAVQQLSAGRTDLVRNRDAMLRAVDGIIYGDNPDQGVVRGPSFIHPPLRFRIDFPNGWDVQNSPEQVMAKAAGAEAYMLLEQVQMPRGNGVENVARAQMENAGFRILSGSRDRVNGLDAYIGLYQGSLEGLGNVRMRAAHVVHNGNVYLVAGFAAPNIFDPLDSAMLMSIRSFKALTPDEAAAVHPNRIDIYVVRPGDSWQSIAERSGGVIKPATLAVMNGAEPNSQPMVGSRIKIVVGG
jgi:predicted Zn-dependent protease